MIIANVRHHRDHPDPIRWQFSLSVSELAGWIGRGMSCCDDPRQMHQLEFRVVALHPVQHDGEAAGNNNARFMPRRFATCMTQAWS